MNNKKFMNVLFGAFGEEHSKQEFDRLFAEFSKTAGKEGFEEWYKESKEDPNKRFPDSWCTLYCDLWKLVPACQEPDLQKRKQGVLDEMQNVLIKNMKFCEKGLIPMNEKYHVLNMMIDIFMAGWFKNKLSLPAILYSWMTDKSNQAYDNFYGEEAKRSLVAYVCEKLSEEERKDIQSSSRVIAQGPRGDFELAVRRYCNVQDEVRRIELSQKYENVNNSAKQEGSVPKEEPKQAQEAAAEERNCIQGRVREETRSVDSKTREDIGAVEQTPDFFKDAQKKAESKNSIDSFIKNNIILVFCLGAFILIGLVFILMGVLGKGNDEPVDISEYEERIEVLAEENEELKKQLEELAEQLEQREKELEKFVNEGLDSTTTDGDISVKTEGEDDEDSSTNMN